MALPVNQIKERLKSPEKRQIINRAIKHENSVRFHVESFTEPTEAQQAISNFLDWVKTLIPKDKFKIFVSLFRFPTPNIKLTGSIFNELERVYDGRNPIVDLQFTDPHYRDDADWYMFTHLEFEAKWRKNSWEALRTAINSVVIVDIGNDDSATTDPYFYFLNIGHVIDFSAKGDNLEWIIFRQPGNKIAVMDDSHYRVFRLSQSGELAGDAEIENAHELGYCPAKFFWTTPLTVKTPDIKKSPISAQLANLDWLLFFSTSKKHLDLYAPYPIYSAIEQDCDYENTETGAYCDGGFLRDSRNTYMVSRDGSVHQCPVCSDRRLVGVGSFIEVPTPEKDGPDLRNPISITTIDRSSLDYNVEEVERLEKSIFEAVTGKSNGADSSQSMNETQVHAGFESKTSVLNSLKRNLEASKKFVLDTICRLRYGEAFIDSTVSMGTEFYIYSVTDLYAKYKTAKESGASEAELDSISDDILKTEYKNDPSKLQRMLILRHLEPYRHLTLKELVDYSKSDPMLIDKEKLKIKINFSTFVDRFERENINIIEFAYNLDFDQKIKIITDKFLDYVREQNSTVS